MASTDMASNEMPSTEMASTEMASTEMESTETPEPTPEPTPTPEHPPFQGSGSNYHSHAKPDHSHGFIERNIYEAKDDLKALKTEVSAALEAGEFSEVEMIKSLMLAQTESARLLCNAKLEYLVT